MDCATLIFKWIIHRTIPDNQNNKIQQLLGTLGTCLPWWFFRTIWANVALHFVPYPFTKSNIVLACLTKLRSVSTYILYLKLLWSEQVDMYQTNSNKYVPSKVNNKLHLMFMNINCRQFVLTICTRNHPLCALLTFMKIKYLRSQGFFAQGAIYLHLIR